MPTYVYIVLALIILIVGLRTFLRRHSFPKPVQNGLEGTAHVVAVHRPGRPSGNHISGLCVMDVVLEAPGIPATAAQYSEMIFVSVWPVPGMDLPASIDPADPKHFSLLWGQLRDRTRGADAASLLAAERNAKHDRR
ncbi:hypothetical protein C5B96_02755 [Subtercola sp. Z020]|uniref:hypothetical protein n=1 Tax=Subtercola sp. Z020 TaxID=2080582 RepID=UPI000CE8C05D|nr:hypothetical protein [Subtercola sp. Z020]PPF88269.1 hypothetical protein C5B96_02755 [Subtercola sp. Z020]